MVDIPILSRIRHVERQLLERMPEHPPEDEEIIVGVHLGQSTYNAKYKPKTQQCPIVVKERLSEESLAFVHHNLSILLAKLI